MRLSFVFSLTAGLVMIASMAANSPAQAYDRKFCLISEGYTYPGDCAYDTYAQCTATASGQQAYCDENPSYIIEQRAGIRRKHTDGFNLSPLIFGGQIYQP